MSAVGSAHVAFGVAALGLGTVNVLLPKGTPVHRLVGHGYYVCMLGLNGTALGIYTFFGTWGIFHWFAVISLVTVFASIVPVALRRPRLGWRYYHGYFMLYSYVGLLAATAAEIIIRTPPLWHMESPNLYAMIAIGSATLGVTLMGSLLVRRTMQRDIERTSRPARAALDAAVMNG